MTNSKTWSRCPSRLQTFRWIVLKFNNQANPREGVTGEGEVDSNGADLSGHDAGEVGAEELQAGYSQDALLSDQL